MLIALAGDSWGYCWTGRGPDFGTLPGLADILRDQGHTVLNLCVAGSSNHQSLIRLSALTVQPDLIIFIQTEPIRDFYTGLCDPKNSARAIVDSEKIFELAQQHSGLDQAMRYWLRTETYSKLSLLQEKFACPVEVIGGCSAVAVDLLPNNLSSTVSSWTELMLGVPDCLFQNSSQWLDHEYSQLVRRDPVMLSDWFTVTGKTMRKILAWHDDTEYFSPDNWHPNYQGHQLLINRLFSGKDS